MSKIDILKRYYHYYGMKMLLLKLFRNHSAENFDYDSWLKKNAITEAELEKQKKYEFAYNPKISIIVPTYETPEMFLRELSRYSSKHIQTGSYVLRMEVYLIR